MSAQKNDVGFVFGWRHEHRMRNSFDLKRARGLRLVGWRGRRTGTGRGAGALSGDGDEPLRVGGPMPSAAHAAVTLAVPAAAGGEIGFGIGGNERRNQRPTEEHQQRDGDGAAHL